MFKYAILPRDAMLARYMLSSCVRPSDRLSVTSRSSLQWQLLWMYCVECSQYSIRFEALGYLCNRLYTSCIQRCLVSHTCDWAMSALSAVLTIYSF